MKAFFGAAFLCAGLLPTPARACDICGCGVSNYNPYLFPHLSKSFVGLSYLHRSYHTRAEDGSSGTEHYNALLLTGQYMIGKRLQVMAALPFMQNSLESPAGNRKTRGFGDATLLGRVLLWDHLTKRARQTVQIGAGVKLATGRYVPAETTKADDQNFQLGTGSTDFVINGAYRLSYRKWMLAAAASYKYNTANSDGFRFGDTWTANLLLVRRIEWNKCSLAPYLQVSHESLLRDADRHVLQGHSGGTAYYAGGGIDLNTKHFTFGIDAQVAADQSLASGQINAGPRLSARTSISF